MGFMVTVSAFGPVSSYVDNTAACELGAPGGTWFGFGIVLHFASLSDAWHRANKKIPRRITDLIACSLQFVTPAACVKWRPPRWAAPLNDWLGVIARPVP